MCKNKKICFFLDRDGTIIRHVHYLNKIEQVKFYKNLRKSIELLKQFGKVFIITNQSAVARGLLSEKDLLKINKYILNFINKTNHLVDKIFFCPHHIDASVKIYKKDCHHRKPGTGFLEKIYSKNKFDKKKSWFIGDTYVDVKTANNFDINSVLLRTGKSLKKNEFNAKPNFISNNLYDASKKIINYLNDQ